MSISTKLTIADTAVNTTYTNITGTTSGTGTGAKFNVTKTNGTYTVEAATTGLGSGYVAGDTITLQGTALGGVSPANDAIVVIGSVGIGGAIASFGFTGTGRVGDGVTDVVFDVLGTGALNEEYNFVGDLGDYTVAVDNGIATVVNGSVNNLKVITNGVERLNFDDKSLALDIDGSAGDVYALLGAALGINDITEEYVGAGLYLKELGWTDKQIAAKILGTNTYKLDAGGVSNETFVKQVWKNIFGTNPTLAEVLEVTDVMDTYGYTQADILVVAANRTDFQHTIELTGIATTGIEFIPYTA